VIALSLASAILLRGVATPAVHQDKPRFKAVAFDYFVLFDANSIVPAVEKEFPGRGLEFTKAWRSKQFEYGFIRSVTHRHEDFFVVTGDALDYTAEAMKLSLTPEVRTRLMNAYLALTPWPDTIAALQRLRAAGVKVITIANFSPRMLKANAARAGIERPACLSSWVGSSRAVRRSPSPVSGEVSSSYDDGGGEQRGRSLRFQIMI